VAPGHSRTTSRDRGAEALIKGPPAPWIGFEMLWGVQAVKERNPSAA
jgi:hypothetical protein